MNRLTLAAALALILTVAHAPAQERSVAKDRSGASLPAGAIARLGTSGFHVLPAKSEGFVWRTGRIVLLGGKTIIAGDRDFEERIVVWDLVGGKELRRIVASGRLGAVSPDGKVMAGWSSGGTFALWDIATGKKIVDLEKAPRRIRVVFSADRKVLVGFTALPLGPGRDPAGAGVSNTIYRWDAASGKALSPFQLQQGNVAAVALSPVGTALAAGDDRGFVQLLDQAKGNTFRTWQAHEQTVVALQFSGDGKVLATSGDDDAVRVWDSGTGRKLQEVSGPAFKLKKKKVQNKVVRFWIDAPFALSRDGKTLVTASRVLPRLVNPVFPAFEVWDVATGEKAELASPPPAAYLHDLALAADGRVIATLAHSGVVSLWDRKTGRNLNPLSGHEDPVERLAVFPDGKRLVTMSGSSIRFWDLGTAKEQYQIAKRNIVGMALSPDGSHLAVASNHSAFVWDIKNKQAVDVPIRVTFLANLAYSADGTKLALWPFLDSMVVFNTRTFNEIWRAEEKEAFGTRDGFGRDGSGNLGDVAFSSDGRFLITSSGYALSLWNSADGRLLRRLAGPLGTAVKSGGPGAVMLNSARSISGFALSPDNRMVAASAGNTLYLWETTTGQERGRFQALEDDSFDDRNTGSPRAGRSGGAVAFSPDGNFLLFGDNGGSIHVVDLATGAKIRRLAGHRGPVNFLAFSPDGRRFFSAGRDTTALVWDSAVALKSVPRDKWRILAGADAAVAYQVIGELAAEPEKTLAYLKNHLPAFADRPLALRALEVLERIATAEARQLLDAYASTGTVADLRPQSQAAARRLERAEKDRQALSTLLQSSRQLPPLLRKDQDGNPLAEGSLARLGTTRFRLPLLAHSDNDLAVFLVDKTLVVGGGFTGASFRFADLASGNETARLSGLEDAGYQFALSPNGKLLAVGRIEDHSLWDLTSRKLVQKGEVGAPLAFSADGKLLAVAAGRLEPGGLKILVCNVKTKARLTLEGSDSAPSHLLGSRRPHQRAAFSPDGKLLAGLTADGNIQLWEIPAGKRVRKWPVQGGPVWILGFSAAGETLATAAVDNTGQANITLWDPSSGKPRRRLIDDKAQLQHAVLSLDGKQLAAAFTDRIDVWEVPSGKHIQKIACPATAGTLAFSRAGQTLASVTSVIRLWDMKTGKQLIPEQGHPSWIDFLGLAPDGSTIVSGGGKTVFLWDKNGQERRRFGPDISAAALSADGKTLALAAKGLHIWDVFSAKELPGLPGLTFKSPRLTLSPNGKVLAVEDAGFSFWDLPSQSLLWKMEAPPKPTRMRRPNPRPVAFSADGKQVAVWDAGTVRLLDASTGNEIRVLAHSDRVSSLAFSGDGCSLVVDSSWTASPFWVTDVRLAILETATGKERFCLTRPNGPFAFSADGRFLAVGNISGEIQIIELPAGKRIRQFQAHGYAISALAFSADGRFLLSGSADTTVLVWDMKSLYEPSAPEKRADPWTILAGTDATRADRMIWTLARTPDKTPAYLEGKLARNHVRISAAVWKRIADLNSDDFKLRTAASVELIKMGAPAELALEQTVRKSDSLETRRRGERLLEQLRKDADFAPEQVALLRAFEVLEKIGSREARRLLDTYSREGADARLRVEARVASERMEHAASR